MPRPARRQAERVAERLSELADDGHIEAYDVYHWKKRIRCDDCEERVSRDLYNTFSEWAAERGRRLAPFFETRECYSMETGEKSDWLVFPALCLVVYEDDELAAVFPHADGDAHRSVADCLDALAGGTSKSDRREPIPAGSAD